MKKVDISKAIRVFRRSFKDFCTDICTNSSSFTPSNVDIEEFANDLKRICLQMLIIEVVQRFQLLENEESKTYDEFAESNGYYCLNGLRGKGKTFASIIDIPLNYIKMQKDMQKLVNVSTAKNIQDAIYLLAYCFEAIIEFSIEHDENSENALKLVVSDNRKKTGAFFTPKSLVEYTVKTVFDRIFNEKTKQELADLKICDPSLGGGLFLIEAANYLTHKLCSTKDKSKFYVNLCENNFYGVDKNPLAIDITSISLKLICHPRKLDEKILNDRFKVGDSLIGTTPNRLNSFKAKIIKGKIGFVNAESKRNGKFSKHKLDSWCSLWFKNINDKELCKKINNFNTSAKISRKRLQDKIKKDKIFHWEIEFPEVFTGNSKGFDVIISNPPYRSYYSRHSGKSADKSSHFERFADANLSEINGLKAVTGRINYFLLFIVKATELMHDKSGICAFVLPDTILMNESYSKMRYALIANKLVKEAIKFSDNQFHGASVGTSVLCWQKGFSNNEEIILKSVSNDEKTQKLSEKHTTLKYSEILKRPHHSMLYSTQIFTFDSSKYVMLDEIAFVKDGINPGRRKMRDKLVTNVTGEKTRKLIEGCNIKEFALTWSGKFIIYDDSAISTQDKLEGTSLRKQWIFESTKIVYRQTAPKIIAAVDLQGFFDLNSVQNIILRESNEELLFALCGYLNSRILRDIYQSLTGETRKTFPQVHVSAVKMLPVPKILLSDLETQHEIAKIARKLTNISLSRTKNDTLNSKFNLLKNSESFELLIRKIDIILNAKMSDY